MTHSSGIPVSDELSQAFYEARVSPAVRFLQVKIIADRLEKTAIVNSQGDAPSDWAQMQSKMEPKSPSFFLFRLDQSGSNDQWIFVSFVPDGSLVKERMIYASSRDNLKRSLGYSYFVDEMHGSSQDDLSWELYQQHDRKKGVADAPLTDSEVQSRAEASLAVDHGHSREYVHSVQFPISGDASSALKQIVSGANNLVQLRVDPQKETIELRRASPSSASSLSSHIPDDEPSFTFFRFDHQFEGASQSPILFIYSCTDGAKVKMRMLYSTVKAVAADAAVQHGVNLAKKLEISDTADLTESYLFEELHPPKVEESKAFSKPSRPGKGRARLVGK